MTIQETPLSQALATVEFVINRRGETKGVFVPLAAWEAVLAALEDIEDLSTAKDYLIRNTGHDTWQDPSTPRQDNGLLPAVEGH
jgi:hypothetical protein